MSIYIPGISMPKSCWDCELGSAQQLDDRPCPFYLMGYLDQEKFSDKIADGCPLVPVPDHGRLIDADALMKKGMPMSWSVQKWVQETDIACAPTIIPAEEGEG
jgi:hypothetical protein